MDVGAAFTSGTANGILGTTPPLDPQSVEGALFLANYYRSLGEYVAAESFCALLFSLTRIF
jgi:hypothetical protein